MTDSRFRILSIDGGGVRGYLSATILANIEQYLNQHRGENLSIGQRFDLIAGTSVGGMLALGLAAGHSASDLRDKLLTLIPKVFGDGNRRPCLQQLWRPQYYPKPLESELRSLFGEGTLADLKTDVCVTSVSLFDAKPRLHKSDYFARNVGRLDTPLVDVALATAAAPTYFKAHSFKHAQNLVDGGLIANNPSMIALFDAVKFQRSSKLGVPAPSLRDGGDSAPLLVSVGTGEPGPLPYNDRKLVNGGKFNWAKPIHEVILLGQAQLIDFQVKFLCDEIGGSYLRINPKLNVHVELDDAERFTDLRNKGDIDAACEQFLKEKFLD